MERYILGAVFLVAGVLFIIRSPRVWLDLGRGKIRGVAGPVLIILGILLLSGVLPGI